MITILGNQMLFQNDEQRFTVGDTNTTSRLFRLNRYEPDRNDISGLTFRLDLEYPTGEKNTALLTKTVQEESIILLWEITKNDFPMEGSVFINIRGVDAQGVMRWNTARAVVFVEGTTNTPGSWDGNLSELEAMEKAISDVLDSEAGRKAAETERKTAEAERKEAEAARSKDVEDNTAARHTHGNKDALDSITAEKIQKWDAGGGLTPEQEQEIRENTAARHTHTNAQTLNKVTEKMLADAEANTAARHIHTNADVLDGITAEQVQKWNKGVGALEYENLSPYIRAESWVEENGEFTATVKVDVKKLTLVIVESVHEYYAVTAEAGISADEGYVDGSGAVNLRAARRPKADILINITMLKGIAAGNTTFTVIDCLPKDSGEAAPAASTAFSDHVLSANAWNSTPEGFFVNNDKHFGSVLPKGTLGYVTAPKTATKEEYDRIAKARLFIHTVNDETETRIVFCAWEKPNADIRLRVSMIKTGNGEQAPMFLNCVHGGGGGLTPEQEQAISANTEARHTHTNKDALDSITAERMKKWDAGGGGGLTPEQEQAIRDNTTARHSHTNQNVLDGINEYNVNKWNDSRKFVRLFIPHSEEYYVPENGYVVPERCCYEDKKITEVEVDKRFTSIGAAAFASAENLKKIHLHDDIRIFGAKSFYAAGCKGKDEFAKNGVLKLTIEADFPPKMADDTFFDGQRVNMYVPAASVQAYTEAVAKFNVRGQFVKVYPIPIKLGDFPLSPNAKRGQFLQIGQVDPDSGYPMFFTYGDAPSGGEKEWELIGKEVIPSQVEFEFLTFENGVVTIDPNSPNYDFLTGNGRKRGAVVKKDLFNKDEHGCQGVQLEAADAQTGKFAVYNWDGQPDKTSYKHAEWKIIMTTIKQVKIPCAKNYKNYRLEVTAPYCYSHGLRTVLLCTINPLQWDAMRAISVSGGVKYSVESHLNQTGDYIFAVKNLTTAKRYGGNNGDNLSETEIFPNQNYTAVPEIVFNLDCFISAKGTTFTVYGGDPIE